MKHRLSHQQTEVIQLIGLAVTGIFPWIMSFVSIQFLPILWGIVGAFLINSVGFYFSFRIYKAEFDEKFLYLTRRLKKKKIALKDVKQVKTLPFPIYVFLGHAYILSLKYSDSNKQKKAFVISRGLFSWTPTIDSISEINLFKQYILDRKYGR
jgi:hypothetical protein